MKDQTRVLTDFSLLTDHDIYLYKEGNHFRLYDKLGAHMVEKDGMKGTQFAVWAPNAARVSVVGDFNQWNPQTHPLTLPMGPLGNLGGFHPAPRQGLPLQVPHRLESQPLLGQQGRSVRLLLGNAAPDRLDGLGPRLPVDRRRLARQAGSAQFAQRPDEHLRSPPGLLAAGPGQSGPAAQLQRDRQAPGRLRQGHGLHARGVPAGHGASVLRVLGLSDARATSPRPAATARRRT